MQEAREDYPMFANGGPQHCQVAIFEELKGQYENLPIVIDGKSRAMLNQKAYHVHRRDCQSSELAQSGQSIGRRWYCEITAWRDPRIVA
jgi:hypothetical protein